MVILVEPQKSKYYHTKYPPLPDKSGSIQAVFCEFCG